MASSSSSFNPPSSCSSASTESAGCSKNQGGRNGVGAFLVENATRLVSTLVNATQANRHSGNTRNSVENERDAIEKKEDGEGQQGSGGVGGFVGNLGRRLKRGISRQESSSKDDDGRSKDDLENLNAKIDAMLGSDSGKMLENEDVDDDDEEEEEEEENEKMELHQVHDVMASVSLGRRERRRIVGRRRRQGQTTENEEEGNDDDGANDTDGMEMEEADSMPGSPVTASPPESPRFSVDGNEENGICKEGLVYEMSVVSIPHPEKAAKGGEDAHFLGGMSMGVFDGVGGWATVGIDPGLYSSDLAKRVEDDDLDGFGVVNSLKNAVRETNATGSSTACVIGLGDAGHRLVGVNVGDSGLIAVRNGEVVMRTKEQQHYFNCPYQLGTDSMDEVGMGDFVDWEIRKGDWIVMATDGLWDNVFEGEVLDCIARAQLRRKLPADDVDEEEAGDTGELSGHTLGKEWAVDQVARELAKRALQVGLDTSAVSPFTINARKAGNCFMGGKLDDITVMVGRAAQDGDGFGRIFGKVVTSSSMMKRSALLKKEGNGGLLEDLSESDDDVKEMSEEKIIKADKEMIESREQEYSLLEKHGRGKLAAADQIPIEPIDDVTQRS